MAKLGTLGRKGGGNCGSERVIFGPLVPPLKLFDFVTPKRYLISSLQKSTQIVIWEKKFSKILYFYSTNIGTRYSIKEKKTKRQYVNKQNITFVKKSYDDTVFQEMYIQTNYYMKH